MKAFLITLFVLNVVLFPCFSDQRGTSDSGERILLKDNGTWEYIQAEAQKDFDFRKTYWGMSRKTETQVVISPLAFKTIQEHRSTGALEYE